MCGVHQRLPYWDVEVISVASQPPKRLRACSTRSVTTLLDHLGIMSSAEDQCIRVCTTITILVSALYYGFETAYVIQEGSSHSETPNDT